MNQYPQTLERISIFFPGSMGRIFLAKTLRHAEVAAEIASKHHHNSIHAHDWMTFPAGLAAKRVSGCKLIVHVHATEIDRSRAHPNPIIFDIEKEGLTGADHIVAVSEWTRQILIKNYRINPSKISVVHNGVVERKDSALIARKKIGSHMVTFPGRITHQKGPMYFVHAAFKVLEKFPDAHFIVAGSGDLYHKMIDQVTHLKLSDRFHFTGFIKGHDIDKIWAMTDVYVMPSVSEPFGITPLEACQVVVPVIIFRQSGVAEVMSHVMKVDFWRSDALANAICHVLAYPSLSQTLRKNSKEELQGVTWEKPQKKLTLIYTTDLRIGERHVKKGVTLHENNEK